jgi:ATP-binding cassette subfamily C protein
MYNTRSGALALIDAGQYAEYCAFAEEGKPIEDAALLADLRRGNYVVDADLDELSALRYRMLCSRYRSGQLGLTIAPTSDCNFRCIYCYEKDSIKPVTMDEKTQAALIKFVEGQISALQHLSVSRYGGEPLLALDIVEDMSNKLMAMCEEHIQKRMTIGELTIVMSYFSTTLSAVRYFFSLGKSVQSNRVCCDRLKRIFDVKEQTNGTERLDDIETIECSGLSFAYGEEKVLDNLSRTFRKGGIYAFVGENGSGKSTLINLLLGLFIDDYEGSIRYNGRDIKTIDMRTLRRELVGVSEQEPILLEETLRFNLTLDDDAELPLEAFSKLAAMINLDSYLESLPEGLDTVVREGAANLSGGEKQKLSIVRALLKNPKLLVLDEPTSALDKASGAHLVAYLQETCEDRIVFISTHDNALIDICSGVVSL